MFGVVRMGLVFGAPIMSFDENGFLVFKSLINDCRKLNGMDSIPFGNY